MIHENIFDNYEININKLLEYGFVKNNDKYVFCFDINDDFYCKVFIDKSLNTEVYDKIDYTIYQPYDIRGYNGEFINYIRNLVEDKVNEIIQKCFIKINLSKEIMEYIEKTFSPLIEHPWEEKPNYITFKKKGKWFCLIMDIEYRNLGIEKDGKIFVMNIKLNPDKIISLIDNKIFFRAYHMNKKYWITVLLNKDMDIELIKQLIKESYDLI